MSRWAALVVVRYPGRFSADDWYEAMALLLSERAPA